MLHLQQYVFVNISIQCLYKCNVSLDLDSQSQTWSPPTLCPELLTNGLRLLNVVSDNIANIFLIVLATANPPIASSRTRHYANDHKPIPMLLPTPVIILIFGLSLPFSPPPSLAIRLDNFWRN